MPPFAKIGFFLSLIYSRSQPVKNGVALPRCSGRPIASMYGCKVCLPGNRAAAHWR